MLHECFMGGHTICCGGSNILNKINLSFETETPRFTYKESGEEYGYNGYKRRETY